MSKNNPTILITPPFKLSYPNLLEPRPFMKNGKPKGDPKYSMEMIFTPEDMKNFKKWDDTTGEFKTVNFSEVCVVVAKEEFEGINVKEAVGSGDLSWPVRNGDDIVEKKGEKAEHYAGSKVISAHCNQDYPPRLYYTDDGERKQLSRATDNGRDRIKQMFYGGAVAYAEVTVKAGDADGNYVTVYVNSVKFVKDGERLGGKSAMDRFEGVDGGSSDIDPTADMDDEIPY